MIFETPIVLTSVEGSNTLTLFGATMLDKIIRADTYDATIAFPEDSLFLFGDRTYKLLTETMMGFRSLAIAKHQNLENQVESLIICVLIPTSSDNLTPQLTTP